MSTSIEALLTEISSALSDLVSAAEKVQDKGTDAALVDALSKLSIKAPDVRVNVPAAAAPTVQMMNDWKSLRIKVGKPDADGSKEFVITKE